MVVHGNPTSGQVSQSYPDERVFQAIIGAVQKNLEKAYVVRKRRYDLRSRPIEYSEGDVVWRKTFPLSDASKGFAAKLAPKYKKCIVRKKIGHSSYVLEDEFGKCLGTFSTKDLKKN